MKTLISSKRRHVISWLGIALLAAAKPVVAADANEQKYPDVVAVKVRAATAQTFHFDATISSPYDTPRRYADAFRVMAPDGTVLGERILWHDHAGEQPFTRDLYNVKIPIGIKQVVVQARDQKFGYGGKTVEVRLPGRP